MLGPQIIALTERLRNHSDPDLRQAGIFFAAALGALSQHAETPDPELLAKVNWLIVQGQKAMAIAAGSLLEAGPSPELAGVPHLGAGRGAEERRIQLRALADALHERVQAVLH